MKLLLTKNPVSRGSLALTGFFVLLSSVTRSETFTQNEVTVFEPPPGASQGIFPGVDLNVFKQYVIGIDVSESVGASFEIDLLFDTLEFGGELGAGIKADFGVEVGFCFGGQTDFEMAFQPSVTLPEKVPYDFPIPLIVDEGRLESSYFATSFGAPQAYADLIFDLNAFLKARACIGYCIDLPFPSLGTRDLPLFKKSTRCDPFIDEEAYFGIELAALNRGNDGKLRFLNVAPERKPGQSRIAAFLEEPYREFGFGDVLPSVPDLVRVPVTGTVVTDAIVFPSSLLETILPATKSGNLKGWTATFRGASGPSGSLPLLIDAGTKYIVASSIETPIRGGSFFQIGIKTEEGTPVAIRDHIGDEIRFTLRPPKDFLPEEEPTEGLQGAYGEVTLTFPTVATDSSDPDGPSDAAEFLRSSGAEDMMGLNLSVTKLVEEILQSSLESTGIDFPGFTGDLSAGPINASYTLATLDLGPAMQLETEFELTWGLVVEEINFHELACDEVTGECSRTGSPANVSIFWPNNHPYFDPNVSAPITQFKPDGRGEVQLTNCGNCALPMIALSEACPNIEVEIKYALQPRLKTTISTPFIGRVSYTAIGASAGIDGVGDLRFGPLLNDEHKFQFGDATVFDGAPKILESVGTGILTFPMKADGPATSDWTGAAGIQGWTTEINNTSNWLTQPGDISSGWPGRVGTSNYARILSGPRNPVFQHPAGRLQPVTLSAMTVGSGKALNIGGPNSADTDFDLHVRNGVVENSGFINFDRPNSAGIMLDYGGGSSDAAAVLCGPGSLTFSGGGELRGYDGPKDFSFTNFNRIRVSQSSSVPGLKSFPVMDLNGPIQPVLYWDFSSVVDTVSGTVGVLTDGASLTNGGHTGQGLRLDGGTERFIVDDVARLNNAARGDQITISYWSKQDLPQASCAFYTESRSSGARGPTGCSPWNDGKVYFYVAGLGDVIIAEPAPALKVQDWHHFAMVKDGGVKQIWVDGKLIAQSDGSGPLATDLKNLVIGSFGLGSFTMQGVLDDFAVFTHALDAESIALLASGAAADALPRTTTINNLNEISTSGGLLKCSASHVINQGRLDAFALPGSEKLPLFALSGNQLSTRRGSRIRVENPPAIFDLSGFKTFDHAGRIEAFNGGVVLFNNPGTGRATWNAGLSLAGDCGIFEAAGGGITLNRSDFAGGCFVTRDGGRMSFQDSRFNNSHFLIGEEGDTEAEAGTLQLAGELNRFENVSLENYGTMRALGPETRFLSTVLFANHGTLEVASDTTFSIFPNRFGEPADSGEAVFYYPGIANYSFSLDEEGNRQGALLGGKWDIRGNLSIIGASITELGGNTAVSQVGSGTRLDDGPVAMAGGESKRISGGRSAEVDLRGPLSTFRALQALRENRGALRLHAGAELRTDSLPSGDLVNRGELIVDGSSELRVGGQFIQTGSDASTQIAAGGTFLVEAQDYQVLGGSLSIGAGSGFGEILPAGTSLRVQAPLLESKELNPFTGLAESRQGLVKVELADGLTGIQRGASLELHGRIIPFLGASPEGIFFPGLALTNNAGAFTLRGDSPHSAQMSVPGNFTNSGAITLEGNGTRLDFAGNFAQNSAGASTRVRPGARLRFLQQVALNGGELVVEISARSPEGWSGSEIGQAFGSGYLVPFQGADFNGRLVVDFVGTVADAKVDIGDTWEIADRTFAINGVTGVEAPEFRYKGGPIPADWLPPGATLEVVQYDRQSFAGTKFGLAVRVVPSGGFTDYYTWAADEGLPSRVTSALADPFADGNNNGIPNNLEYFYGINGIDLTAPYVDVTSAPNAELGRDTTLTFLRPSGLDASYTPYVSEDLITWTVAPMEIQDVVPEPETGLERVILKSRFPGEQPELFFRLLPSFNPDNFEIGLLPTTLTSRLINHSGPVRNIDQDLNISYQFVPGRVLFFNVTGTRRAVGGSVFGGTADDAGLTRNFIYRDDSHLGTAAVHAGLLSYDERGVIKVTLLDPQAGFIGSEQPVNGLPGEQLESEGGSSGAPNAKYSYRIELERLLD